METYNQYLTEGIHNGTINTRLIDGVVCYIVRKPMDDEKVMGYTNFSSLVGKKTYTELAEYNPQ